MKKYLSITLFVLFAFILSVFSPYTAHASDDPLANPSEVALEYMDAREDALKTGDTAALSAIAISGIVTDEIKHREYLLEHNIMLPQVTYTVDTVEALDGGAIVALREVGVSNSIEVSHTLLITTNENDLPFVVSDEYIETHTGFTSCSYVAPDASVQTRALNEPVSRNCLLHVARKELGYLEKASNSQLDSKTANPGNKDFTKYGAWIGNNGQPWCTAFISWCADQANIPTSIIPKTASVLIMKNSFSDYNRYYNTSKGAVYTPKTGDIIFMYHDGYDLGHAGIVRSVSGNYVTIIEGNWNLQVGERTLSLTNTTITGYGSPNISRIEHIWIGDPMVEYCENMS